MKSNLRSLLYSILAVTALAMSSAAFASPPGTAGPAPAMSNASASVKPASQIDAAASAIVIALTVMDTDVLPAAMADAKGQPALLKALQRTYPGGWPDHMTAAINSRMQVPTGNALDCYRT